MFTNLINNTQAVNLMTGAAPATPEASPVSMYGSIIMLVVFFAFAYFFMIRPQKKQEKETKQMRDSIAVGDEITTIGGIIGKIISIKDETILIETSGDRTKIRLLKSAVRCVDVKAEDAE